MRANPKSRIFTWPSEVRNTPKEPRRRYPSAESLADDLRRYLAGEPITARPIGITERAAKWARRRPATAISLAVITLALLTLFVGSAWSNVRLQRPLRSAAAQRERAEQYLRMGQD